MKVKVLRLIYNKHGRLYVTGNTRKRKGKIGGGKGGG